MTIQTLDIYQINGKRYVSPRGAARYLGIADDRLQGEIYDGKLIAKQIESRQFIELETLKVYAENHKLKAGGWGKVDAFKG